MTEVEKQARLKEITRLISELVKATAALKDQRTALYAKENEMWDAEYDATIEDSYLRLADR